MPRSKRGDIKLRHDQILNAIEKATGYLTELHDMFLEVHPQYSEGYKNIIIMLATAHDFVEKMKSFI